MKGSKKMEKKVYEKVLEENKIKRPILSNCIKAFLVGGSICLIGQVLLYLFEEKMGIKKTEAYVYCCCGSNCHYDRSWYF